MKKWIFSYEFLSVDGKWIKIEQKYKRENDALNAMRNFKKGGGWCAKFLKTKNMKVYERI